MAIVVATLDVLLRADGSSLRRGLQEAENDIDRFSRRVSDRVKQVGRIMTAGLTLPIIAGFGLAVKAAVNFEDAFAGVRKTLDATEAEFQQVSRALRDMATDADRPVSSLKNAQVELAGIAEVAGQLGISISDIEEFTEVMGELAMSTDIAARQGALKLAQFINITKSSEIPIRMLADVIVDLGNNMSVTESTILLTAQRMAAAGSIAGATAPELLGLAAAVSELGQTSAVGGTSMTKFFGRLIRGAGQGGATLQAFADTAGLSADEFVAAYEEDATSAILTFIAGLDQLSPVDLLNTLDTLAIKGARQVAVMQGLAQVSDRVAFAQELVNIQMAGGNALSIEATKRAKTTASQFNLMRNTLRDLGIEIGNILLPVVNEIVGGLTKFFAKMRDLNPEILKASIVVLALVASIGPLLFIIGSLLNPLGLLIIATGAVVTAMGGFAAIGDMIKNAIPSDVVTAIENIVDALTNFSNIVFPTGPEGEKFIFNPEDIFGESTVIEIPGITFSLPPGSTLASTFRDSEELQTMFGTQDEFVKSFLEAFPELTTTTIPANTEFTLGADSVTITDTGGLADFKDKATGVGTLYGTTFGERLALAFETVKPQLTEAANIIGNAILESLGNLASALPGFLLNKVLPAVTDGAMELGRRLGKFILGGLKDKIQDSGGLIGLADDFLLAFAAAFAISSGFRKIALTIGSRLAASLAATTLGSQMIVGLTLYASSIVSFLTAAIALALSAVGAGILIGAAIFLYFTNDSVKAQIDAAGTEIVDTLFGEGQAQKARDSIQAFFDESVTPVIINVIRGFGGVLNIISFVFSTKNIKAALRGFDKALEDLTTSIVKQFNNIFGKEGILKTLIGNGISLITGLWDVFINAIAAPFREGGSVIEAFDNLEEFFTEILPNGIGAAIKLFISDDGAWGKFKSALSTIWETVSIPLGQLESGIISAFNQMLIPVDALLFAIRSIVGAVQSAIDAISSLPSGIQGEINIFGHNVNPATLLPGEAMGGFISRNTPTLIGERGPELFVPNTGGRVIPNHQLGGGGGGLTLINPTFIGQSPTEVLQVLERTVRDQGL